MILIAMIIGGLFALIKGEITITKGKSVRGWPARVIGLVLLAPLPLQFAAGIVWGLILAIQQRPAAEIERILIDYGTGVELAILFGCLILALVMASALSKPPVQPSMMAASFPPTPPPSDNPYAPPSNPFAER